MSHQYSAPCVATPFRGGGGGGIPPGNSARLHEYRTHSGPRLSHCQALQVIHYDN